MTKLINKRWQLLLLATIAALIVQGASGAAFAQKADKYPKPDFTAMEEYYEIVEHEYDFTTNIPTLYVIAKPKQKVVPTWWEVTWRDSKGVAIDRALLYFDDINKTKIGEVTRGHGYAPFKTKMPKVASVTIVEHSDPHEQKTAN
jgi:hypothetical protein